jgi:hypothetical protein
MSEKEQMARATPASIERKLAAILSADVRGIRALPCRPAQGGAEVRTALNVAESLRLCVSGRL